MKNKINKKGLKAALSRHIITEQTNKKKADILKATAELQKLKQKSKVSGNTKVRSKKHQTHEIKQFIPFQPDNHIILIGEGDFSFAVSIIKQNFIPGPNVVATSYDSLQELKAKYPNVEENLEFLTQQGVNVVYEIDATKLVSSFKLDTKKAKAQAKSILKIPKIDYIVFNFPHTGRGMKDMDRNIRDHQVLMLNYFKSCKQMFEVVNDHSQNDFGGYDFASNTNEGDEGKIIVTLFEGEPYNSWQIKSLARSENYRVEKSSKFEWSTYPEYHHRRTNSTKDTTKPASERDARIYIFEGFKPKKVKEDSDSE